MKTNQKAQKRLSEIEEEARKASIVKVNSMVIVTDATENTLDCAVLFIKAGDNTFDAVQEAATNGGIRNAHERLVIPLPANFDDDAVYWFHCYCG